MKLPDNLFVNRFIKWAAVATLILIYFVTYKDTVKEKVSEKIDEVSQARVENAPIDVVIPKVGMVDSNGESSPSVVNGIVQNVMNKVSATEEGKMLIRSISEQVNKKGKDEYRFLDLNVKDPHNIYFSDVIRGYGARIGCNAKVTYDYRAYLPGDLKFETSYKPEHIPVTLLMGKRQVIPGLEQGLIGMQEGGRRKISIPPALGYSFAGFENSSAEKNKILLYDVEIVKVENGTPPVLADTPLYEVKLLKAGNNNEFVECGEFVSLEYHVKNDIEQAAEEAPTVHRFLFQAGSGKAPLGMEEALIGLHQGGEYEIKLPEYWQKTEDKESPMYEILKQYRGKNLEIQFKIVSIDR